MSEIKEYTNLIDYNNLEKYNISKDNALDSVVAYFKRASEHGYFFATINIGDCLNEYLKTGVLEDRIIHGQFKTAIENDYSTEEVCLVFKEFSRIASNKYSGDFSSCTFYDIKDDRSINFFGAFEGEKKGEEFELTNVLVEDIESVLTTPENNLEANL